MSEQELKCPQQKPMTSFVKCGICRKKRNCIKTVYFGKRGGLSMVNLCHSNHNLYNGCYDDMVKELGKETVMKITMFEPSTEKCKKHNIYHISPITNTIDGE